MPVSYWVLRFRRCITGCDKMIARCGLTIYDTIGDERGGLGFAANGRRAAFALDRANGDAVGMLVDDKTLPASYPFTPTKWDMAQVVWK